MEETINLIKTNTKTMKGGAFPECHLIQNLFIKFFVLNNRTHSHIVSRNKSIEYKIKQLYNNRLLLKETKIMINKNLANNFGNLHMDKKFQKYIKFTHCGSTRIIKLISKQKDVLHYFQKDKIKKHLLYSMSQQTNQKNKVENKKKSLAIPKAISNWKNPRGFSIPLHHRNNALNEVKINLNQKFIYLSNVIDLLDK